MKFFLKILAAVSGALAAAAAAAAAAPADAQETLSTSRFGTIRLYGDRNEPQSFIMLLSDAAGWDRGAEAAAEALGKARSLVAGIDTKDYLAKLSSDDEGCHYPAGEFERLAQVIQQNTGLKAYHRPLIAGYRTGGALVYAILAEGPGSIDAGLSIGFCPVLPLDGPICGDGDQKISEPGDAEGTVRLLPVKKAAVPWFVKPVKMNACDEDAQRAFASQIGNAQIADDKGASSGNVFAEFLASGTGRMSENKFSTGDLPLIEVPAQRKERDYFAVFVSGDGGWASIDREIGDLLAEKGISVTGLDALRYFWSEKSPGQAGKDLERIIRDRFEDWNQSKVVLIGYSLGADVLPPMYNELSREVQDKVVKVVLLNPSKSADLQVHLTDWIGLDNGEGKIPLLPELRKIGARKLFCVYGLDDDDTICRGLDPAVGRAVGLEGSHHFDGNYSRLAGLILEELPQR